MQKITKAIAAIMLTMAVVCAVGCKKNDNPNNGGNGGGNNGNNSNGTYNGHEYVDLGLPSGTLWATCNIGATKPEGYGDYFAWGETEPKTIYDWCTYKYCNDCDPNLLTRYCYYAGYGYNGFTDNLTVLQPMDDATTANWGSGWRMPTSKQWRELSDNTTVTWTTQNSVKGRKFTASNGNSLFLPSSGYYDGSSLGYGGSYGCYWSSLLNDEYPGQAWYFYFDSGDDYYVYHGGNRYNGRSVRAVREN